MKFDRAAYLDELGTMFRRGLERWRADCVGIAVFTISVWTDPGARKSALSFDTRANSDRVVAEINAYDESQRTRLLAAGDVEMAELFTRRAERNGNPADFAHGGFAVATHDAFAEGWDEVSEAEQWKLLEPALIEFAPSTFDLLAGLRLEPGAWLGVNGPNDWFEHVFAIHGHGLGRIT